jgi:hypothetical protein
MLDGFDMGRVSFCLLNSPVVELRWVESGAGTD